LQHSTMPAHPAGAAAIMAAFHAADDADHPKRWLDELAVAAGVELDSAEYAKAVDAADPLREFRGRFHVSGTACGTCPLPPACLCPLLNAPSAGLTYSRCATRMN
jgi:hypothetical protein